MFGYNTYYSDRWPTRDHIIPFKMFFLMLRAGGHVEAATQLIQTLATAHGGAMLWSGKDSFKIKSQTRALIRNANPEAL